MKLRCHSSLFLPALLLILAPSMAFRSDAADYAATVLQDKPVGYWRLGEATGTNATNSGALGAAANGVAINNVTFGLPGAIPGDANTAANFDGAAAKIEVPYAQELNQTAFTIEVWAKVASGSTGHRSPLASRDDTPAGNTAGYILYADPGDNWQFWTGRGSGNGWHNMGGATVAPDEWAHLVGTFDGVNKAFYVNGVLVGAGQTTLVPNRARVLRIAGSANESEVGNFFFNGDIDEVAIYGAVLSGDRILAHYKAAGRSDPAPVAPAIVVEPQSLERFRGDNVTLSVLATGSLPLNFQWKRNDADIPGATGQTLTLTNVQTASTGTYKVVVRNPGGDATSADAALNVTDISKPVITQQPRPRTVLQGANAAFDVIATGSSTFQYQWQFNGANLASATNATLSVTNVQPSNTGTYRVVVSNAAGNTVSDAAVLQILAPAAKNYVETIKADGPVGYWRLGETTGETARDVLGKNDGAYLNGVTLGVPGALLGDADNAVAFQSSSRQKIDVPFSVDLNPEVFSAEVWAKVTGGGSHRSPLTSRGDFPQRGYIFYAEPGNTWQFWTGNGEAGGWNVVAGPAVVNDAWAHLVGTFDGTTKRFYVNGLEVGSSTPSFGPNTENPLRFGGGATEGDGNYFFEGSVDEAAIYNKVLTPEQIILHFAAGRPTQSAPTLSIASANNKVVLTWTGGTLQEADQITGTWQNATGATSPHTVTPTGTQKFYRVRR